MVANSKKIFHVLISVEMVAGKTGLEQVVAGNIGAGTNNRDRVVQVADGHPYHLLTPRAFDGVSTYILHSLSLSVSSYRLEKYIPSSSAAEIVRDHSSAK